MVRSKGQFMDRGVGTAESEGRTGLATERAFLGTSALLFIASAGGTAYLRGSMSGGMPMPEQTWLSAVASFMGMWVIMMMAMMMAMMLPSLVPTLLSYRRSLHRLDKTRIDGLTALAGAGYFSVWAVCGALAYSLTFILTAAEMQWVALARSVPATTGIVLLLAGCFQLTTWKGRQLRCCRDAPAWVESLSPSVRGAWWYGLSLGMHCCLCCAGFIIILLVTGMMDLGIMALVAAAITVERLAPKPERVVLAAGIVIIVAGARVITRAIGMV